LEREEDVRRIAALPTITLNEPKTEEEYLTAIKIRVCLPHWIASGLLHIVFLKVTVRERF
jgi:hypothetical protein